MGLNMAQSSGKELMQRVSDRVSAGRARNRQKNAIMLMANPDSPTKRDQHEMLREAVYGLHTALALEDWEYIEEVTALIEDAIEFKLSES